VTSEEAVALAVVIWLAMLLAYGSGLLTGGA
jgi:hypothetical protein